VPGDLLSAGEKKLVAERREALQQRGNKSKSRASQLYSSGFIQHSDPSSYTNFYNFNL